MPEKSGLSVALCLDVFTFTMRSPDEPHDSLSEPGQREFALLSDFEPGRPLVILPAVFLCPGGYNDRETMETKARALLVGLQPDIVDYSKSPVPGLTEATVRAAVDADGSRLESLGYSVKSLYVDDGKTAELALANSLTTGRYKAS